MCVFHTRNGLNVYMVVGPLSDIFQLLLCQSIETTTHLHVVNSLPHDRANTATLPWINSMAQFHDDNVSSLFTSNFNEMCITWCGVATFYPAIKLLIIIVKRL